MKQVDILSILQIKGSSKIYQQIKKNRKGEIEKAKSAFTLNACMQKMSEQIVADVLKLNPNQLRTYDLANPLEKLTNIELLLTFGLKSYYSSTDKQSEIIQNGEEILENVRILIQFYKIFEF